MISTFNLLTNRYYFSAGMIRSGSTLLYNILRIILQMKYNGNISCGWIDDYDKLEKNRRYLIKTHSINRKLVFGAEHIFYTYRDIRECLLSFKIRFGTEPTKALCDSQINQYLFLKNKALFIKYESLTEHTRLQIEKIQDTLNTNFEPGEIIRQLPELIKSNAFSDGYDTQTLMHKIHGTEMKKFDWKNQLDNDLLRYIENNYHWWFKETGYMV